MKDDNTAHLCIPLSMPNAHQVVLAKAILAGHFMWGFNGQSAIFMALMSSHMGVALQ